MSCAIIVNKRWRSLLKHLQKMQIEKYNFICTQSIEKGGESCLQGDEQNMSCCVQCSFIDACSVTRNIMRYFHAFKKNTNQSERNMNMVERSSFWKDYSFALTGEDKKSRSCRMHCQSFCEGYCYWTLPPELNNVLVFSESMTSCAHLLLCCETCYQGLGQYNIVE